MTTKQEVLVNKRSAFTRLMIAVSLLVVASACGGDGGNGTGEESDVEEKKVTFVGPLHHPVWLKAKQGFEETGEKLGLDTSWVAPQGVDIAQSVQMVETAIASGADGIATCALDPDAFIGVLEEAKADSIPVILVDCDVEDKSLRTSYVGTVGQTFGEESGDRLAEMTNGKAKIIVMQGQFDAAIQNEILEGFKDGISDEPGMEIIARAADNSDLELAVKKFEALFRTHSDATAVYCIEASCAQAAAQVAKEQGLLDQLLIFGTDDLEPTVEGIRDGDIEITAAQDFCLMGELAAQYLADALSGEEVPAEHDTGVIFVDEENADNYNITEC